MIVSILAALFLLGFCVFFHELGHYLAGKLVGVRARIFSIGYGKGRFKKQWGDTTFQITAIPLGGYVQFYGDDITKKHEEIAPGDFFSVGPWKRILIALGGPFFSILLGLIVIYFLLVFGWQPITNKIQVPNSLKSLPVGKVMQDGDRILAVNGNETNSFEEITYHIALSPKKEIDLKIERNGKIIEKSMLAHQSKEAGPLRIGIRPHGESYLSVQKTKEIVPSKSAQAGKRLPVKILEGDKIVEINGVSVTSVPELRKISDENMNSNITLGILRESNILIPNSQEERVNIEVPVQEVEYAALENITYLNKKYTEKLTEVGPWYENYLSIYKIEDESYDNWDEFRKALAYHIARKKTNRLRLIEMKEPIEATISFKKRGMLGLHLSESLEPGRAALPTDFFSLFARTYNQTIFVTKSTVVGLYRIFQGKLSFRQSVSGPIKILDYARQSVNAGWDVYWFLLANITIILGIMNLLPIPVLDGGHVFIYLIEGIYKPLPVKVIAASVRAGFVALFTIGIYVISIDVWDVFLKRFF